MKGIVITKFSFRYNKIVKIIKVNLVDGTAFGNRIAHVTSYNNEFRYFYDYEIILLDTLEL